MYSQPGKSKKNRIPHILKKHPKNRHLNHTKIWHVLSASPNVNKIIEKTPVLAQRTAKA